MNILIIGCSWLGGNLANVLDAQGHYISVIDDDPDRFDMLDDNFSGLVVTGNPIDEDVMRSAGIEGCDYVVCVTELDNTNIMSAQVAHENFQIDNIICSVLNPVKAHAFESLGISTVCPTTLAFEEVCIGLFGDNPFKLVHYGGAAIRLETIPFNKHMRGKRLSQLNYEQDRILFGVINRDNKLTLYNEGHDRPIEETDRLVYAMLTN